MASGEDTHTHTHTHTQTNSFEKSSLYKPACAWFKGNCLHVLVLHILHVRTVNCATSHEMAKITDSLECVRALGSMHDGERGEAEYKKRSIVH